MTIEKRSGRNVKKTINSVNGITNRYIFTHRRHARHLSRL